jgi:hypothetical protein
MKGRSAVGSGTALESLLGKLATVDAEPPVVAQPDSDRPVSRAPPNGNGDPKHQSQDSQHERCWLGDAKSRKARAPGSSHSSEVAAPEVVVRLADSTTDAIIVRQRSGSALLVAPHDVVSGVDDCILVVVAGNLPGQTRYTESAMTADRRISPVISNHRQLRMVLLITDVPLNEDPFRKTLETAEFSGPSAGHCRRGFWKKANGSSVERNCPIRSRRISIALLGPACVHGAGT